MRQWLRTWTLTFGGGGGAVFSGGGDEDRNLSSLRVKFYAKMGSTQSPNTLEVKVYNLNPTHEEQFRAEPMEFKEITMDAGYVGNTGRIFGGDVRRTFLGKEFPNCVDSFGVAYGACNDKAYSGATVNKSLPAKSTGKDVRDVLLKSMEQFGVKLGPIQSPLLDSLKYPRSLVLFGNTKDHLRQLAHSVNSIFYFDIDRGLNIVPATYEGIGSPIVLNSRTGLIGLPQQTQMGIIARVLINPAIRVHSKVHIDQASVQQMPPEFWGNEPLNSQPFRPSVAADGIYTVIAIDIMGDSHGTAWFMDLACIKPNEVSLHQLHLGRS
jgi:hypothetical protein